MISNSDHYTDYFRQLAVKHKDLQHIPASETPDGKPSDKHFSRWTVDDVIVGNLKCGYPILLLEMFETVTHSQVVYDIKGTHSGAITVVDHISNQNSQQQIDAALSKTEIILFQLLQRIWQDHYGPAAVQLQTPFDDFDFNALNIMAIGPVLNSNEFGWRCSFNFQFRENNNITTPPLPGTFTDE